MDISSLDKTTIQKLVGGFRLFLMSLATAPFLLGKEKMSLQKILQLLLYQAQHNGFDFQQWFQAHIHAEWPGSDPALSYLSSENRHYALLFSHDFARHFWLAGAHISFSVPSVTYSRVNSHGEVIEVTRKPFTRRTIKPDAWKYHLREMAAAENPLFYLCRFLPAAQQASLKISAGNGDGKAVPNIDSQRNRPTETR